jgi:hypothetical protein
VLKGAREFLGSNRPGVILVEFSGSSGSGKSSLVDLPLTDPTQALADLMDLGYIHVAHAGDGSRIHTRGTGGSDGSRIHTRGTRGRSK